MRIRETNDLNQLDSLAKNYYNAKVSNIEVLSSPKGAEIKMEKTLGKEKAWFFKMCFVSQAKFYDIKSSFFNQLAKASISLGGEDKFKFQEDVMAANAAKDLALHEKSMAEQNKRIVSIKYTESGSTGVIPRMNELRLLLIVNSTETSPFDKRGASLALGQTRVNQRNEDEAINFFEIALKNSCSDKDKLEIFEKLGPLYSKKPGKEREAFNVLNKVSEKKPDNFYILKEMGKIAQTKGQEIQLENHLDKAAEYYNREMNFLDQSQIELRCRQIGDEKNGKEVLEKMLQKFELINNPENKMKMKVIGTVIQELSNDKK